ncbi:MAG: hypothetical protein GY765_43930, partial [bacterium]|nr:hypothetical protein [bacterium]
MIKKITLWLTVLLVFLFAAAVQVEAAIPTHERDALTALYNATNGDGWNNNTNWKNNNNDVDGFSQFGSEGSWHGITVSGDHVVEIVLSSNRLEGNLPAALGALSHLRKLELRLNRLSGSIPTALADLNRLTYLNLGGNSLEGNIPVELSNLVNLTYLNLGGNHLNGPIPQDFGYLVNLEYLHLGGNNLSGSITKKLGYLDKLRYLNLEKNGFSGSIPPALGSLVKLEALYLRHNRLQREVPAKLGDLVNLKKFYINGNHLIGNLPAELERLTALNPGETSINYNGFEPAQGGLASFLNGKVPGWDTTQTVAPRNISASILSDTSVRISWTPIPYTADEGKYYIFYSTTKGGPYEYHGETATKYDSHYDAEGLTPGLTYYFVLKTRTFAHENNSNKITTDYSNEVEIKLGSSYILTVRTLPDAGAEIIVTPADMNGNGNGISNFTRDYYGGTGVTVTAPNFHNGRQFRNWMIDGEEVRTELTINVTMNSNHTVEAIYEKIKYTLEVETTPETGAFITVNPTDSNGLGDGTSNFARLYEDGTQVSVVAPTEYNGRLFSKFTIDGVNNSSNSIQVTMNQNHKVIAFYVNKEFTLEVETTPETGASITVTPTDNNGHGNGTSNFSRLYTDGTQVSVVAPSEYNGRLFQKFTIDGVANSSNSIQVTMNQNHKVIAFYVKKEYKLYVQTLPETGASMTVVPNDNNN